LPRLVNAGALFSAVRKGVAAKTFAVAEDFRDGKYLELQFAIYPAEKFHRNIF